MATEQRKKIDEIIGQLRGYLKSKSKAQWRLIKAYELLEEVLDDE